MTRRPLSMLFLTLALVAASCAPVAREPAGRQSQADSAQRVGPRALSMVIQGEPRSLAPHMTGDIGGSPGGTLRMAVHQPLVSFDERGDLHPRLATEMPSQATGSWRVNADGSMQTTHKLRPNIFWHDGTPLSSRDFVFAWTVAMDNDLTVESRRGSQFVTGVETPDDSTVVLNWSKPNPFVAELLTEDDIYPLPRHLLQSAYESDKERFQRLSYWSQEFVGVGPYQIADWQLGSHLVLKAFDRFFLGKPKIDTVTVRFATDENTATATLLAGSVDGELRILSFQQVMHVKQEWEAAGKKPYVPIRPTFWRSMDVQFRPEFARPRDVLDLRVRKGLLHAIDRSTMVDSLYDGLTTVSDAFISTDDVRWDGVKDVALRYEYDSRKAQDLLTQAGWRRGQDGAFVTAAGERVAIPLWTTSGETWEHEMAITADNWKAIGVGAEQFVIPTARARDRQTRASFPAFSSTATAVQFTRMTRTGYGAECGTEATRWVGDNRGCYQNPALDRLIDGLHGAMDPNEQRRLTRDLVRFHTEELPALPMYFHVQASIFREGVTGPTSDTKPPTSATWNIHEWDVK